MFWTEVTPKYPAKVVNEILELNCTVFSDSGLNSSLLFWEVPFNENVSQDQVSINGDRTLLFRKNITDIEMEGNYICRRKDKEDFLESMVGSVAVVTECESFTITQHIVCEIIFSSIYKCLIYWLIYWFFRQWKNFLIKHIYL